MKTANNSKRALLASILSIALCLSMLIGTTFAWFTDTATAGVSKITSGTLTVEIQNENNQKIETLNWVAQDGRTQDKILWEPGCTYTLTPFKIVNTGSLALKYKMVVTGLEGDSKLLDVIKFTYKLGDAVLDLNAEGHLTAKGTNGAATGLITISATMDKNAGNEYQDKTLDGVSIKVYATQDTVESDSKDNQYDKKAVYPIVSFDELKKVGAYTGTYNITEDLTVTEPLVVTSMSQTLDATGKTVSNTENLYDAEKYNWSLISVRKDGFFAPNLTITGGTFKAKEGDCRVIDIRDGGTVTIKDGTFIGNISAVYVEKGTLNIEGGTFSIQEQDQNKGYEFLLNCLDANFQNGSAKIIVTGGTFVNFNPADCQAEGEHTNFVAGGYKVISETQSNGDTWYTVVAQ